MVAVASVIFVLLLLWQGGFSVHAQTVEALQAQINALLQTIIQLQGELATLSGKEGVSPGFTVTTFARNLHEGDEGEDVRQLQFLLNTNIAHRVSESGPGSPGQESIYFGARTKKAVIIFQDIYKDEILIPLGLTQGTGIVGTATRAKLNAMLYSIPAGGNQNVTSPQSEGNVVAAGLSKNAGGVGTTVVIRGRGFDEEGNTILINDEPIGTFSSITPDESDGLYQEIIFSFPASINGSEFEPGMFSIVVVSQGGKSTPLSFTVTESGEEVPVINSITPNSGPYGTVITIKGSGFSPTGNMVVTTTNEVENLSSPDGNTLQFTLSHGLEEGFQGFPFNHTINISVGVDNKSSNKLPFVVTASPLPAGLSQQELDQSIKETWDMINNTVQEPEI